MSIISKSSNTEFLKKIIIDSLSDLKAKDIVVLDLHPISEAVADYFIICHGESTTQVNALAGNVVEQVKQKTNETTISREGFSNAEWALVDYGDIVVHIFLKEKREYYQLENLWSDALREDIKEEVNIKITQAKKNKDEQPKQSNAGRRKK